MKPEDEKIFFENEKAINFIINTKFPNFVFTKEQKEDLYQVGAMELIRSIENFDISLNLKLSTYCMNNMYFKMLNYINYDSTIKPLRKNNTVKKVNVESLNVPIKNGTDNRQKNDKLDSILDTLDDEKAEKYYDIINFNVSLDNIFEKSHLTEIEKQCFILSVFYNVRQVELARKFNTNQGQVSRCIKTAKNKLKEYYLKNLL